MGAKTYQVRFEIERIMGKPTSPIHLDSLLSAARTIENNNDWSVQHDIPVSRFYANNNWCFKASTLVIKSHSQNTIVNRNTTDRLQLCDLKLSGVSKINDKIDNQRGIDKTEIFAITHLLCDEAYGYLVTDDPARALALLKQLNHLGPKRGRGYGRILNVTMSEANETESEHWQYRNLPSPIDEQCIPCHGQLRAPYWAKNGEVVYNKTWLLRDLQ